MGIFPSPPTLHILFFSLPLTFTLSLSHSLPSFSVPFGFFFWFPLLVLVFVWFFRLTSLCTNVFYCCCFRVSVALLFIVHGGLVATVIGGGIVSEYINKVIRIDHMMQHLGGSVYFRYITLFAVGVWRGDSSGVFFQGASFPVCLLANRCGVLWFFIVSVTVIVMSSFGIGRVLMRKLV